MAPKRSSQFSRSRKTTQHFISEEGAHPVSVVQLQSLDLKHGASGGGSHTDLNVASEEQLLALEIPGPLPFEAGPEYESMVSRALDPRKSEQRHRALDSLEASALENLPLQQSERQNRPLSGEYYEIVPGEGGTEEDYGPGCYIDLREYLRSFARDAEHLSHLLIEQKICRVDLMERISEEHSADLENSVITHAVNKSVIFRDPKLMHSDSWWVSARPTTGGVLQEGRHLVNTSFGSRREISRNLLNNSNNFSRELNSSFKLMASQGDLGSSRLDDPDLRGLLLRNSSFKHKKFPPKRKISLKVDGKKSQESQFFLVPEKQNNRSRCVLYSPEKMKMVARLKTIRNSDVTERRKTACDVQHSRSLNNSGLHSMSRKKGTPLKTFDLENYSFSREDHSSVAVARFEAGSKLLGESAAEKGPAKLLRTSAARLKELSPIGGESGAGNLAAERLKRDSLTFFEGPDFEFSCVELNESKENHLDSESIRNIVDPCLGSFRANSVIQYELTELETQSAPRNEIVADSERFKKVKFGEAGLDRTQRTYTETNESWMKYPSLHSQLPEHMQFPRKISEIPVVDSAQRGSLIMFGGDMTPLHKRSEILENTFRRDSRTETRDFDAEPGRAAESKQNITDLMKMIIQKTESLAPVEEVQKTGKGAEKQPSPGTSAPREERKPAESQEARAESRDQGASEHFDSCITNMPSTVNIESTANLQTIFDLDYDPEFLPTQRGGAVEPRTRKMKGSMLTDEPFGQKDVFRIVSCSDNESDPEGQIDSFLLKPNSELGLQRTREGPAGSKAGTSESNPRALQSQKSGGGGFKEDKRGLWAKKPELAQARPECFKKTGLKLPQEKLQEIMEAKSTSLKQKFRNSKLGLKITRMSRKAGRTEIFKMRSPTTLSITNHTDLSDPKQGSSQSQLKRPLKNPHNRRLREKLWESLMSSKKNDSLDTNSKFDRTLGSVSIQSLLKKSHEVQLPGADKQARRALRKTDEKFTWKAQKPRYQSGYLKQGRARDLGAASNKKKLLSLKTELENSKSTSRIVKSSLQGSNLIYSKISQADATRKELRRSNTLQRAPGGPTSAAAARTRGARTRRR